MEVYGATLGQHQRGLQGQLGDLAEADLVTGVHGQFEVGGGGQDGTAQDTVVGEPSVGAGRQPPAEDEPAGVGDPDGGRQQRVTGALQPGGGDITGVVGGGVQPVATPLKGVGR